MFTQIIPANLLGQVQRLCLTDSDNTGFLVVPLYVYDSSKKMHEMWNAALDEAGDKMKHAYRVLLAKGRTAEALQADYRLVCAVPQSDEAHSVQLFELKLPSIGRMPHGAKLNPAGIDCDVESADAADGPFNTQTLSLMAMGRAFASMGTVTVTYAKPAKKDKPAETAHRRLRPLQVWSRKPKGGSELERTVFVLCDDIDKKEPGKTFRLDRMSGPFVLHEPEVKSPFDDEGFPSPDDSEVSL